MTGRSASLLMRGLLAMSFSATAFATGQAQSPALDDRSPKFVTTYDSGKGRTTVRLASMQVSTGKGEYHSLHMSPAFNYPGRKAAKPEFIDFELITIVKGKLRVDLYVTFIVDGETIFLSSNRWGVKHPVPGRRWMGEHLVFRMPLATLVKLANAKTAAVKMDATEFEFNDAHGKALRALVEKISAL